MLPLLLLFVLKDTLAVTPGDEYDGCEVPNYPVNVKVLLDSWRYQTLLAQNDNITNTAAVWTTENTERSDTWYSSGGVCEDSAVAVCSGESGEKWLKTQYINKSLPAPDEYPVRVFVNITYSSLACPQVMCDRDFELHIAHNDTNDYTGDVIRPNNRIELESAADNVTKQFYFDLNEMENGFFLVLNSRPKGVCVNVSRVLVYRHECPGHERQSTGLTRRPATQAPVHGAVAAIAGCAENSYHSHMSQTELLLCTSKGHWLNDQTDCVCDIGYSKDGDKCNVSTTPSETLTTKTTSVSRTSTLTTNTLILSTHTPTIKPTDLSDREDGGGSINTLTSKTTSVSQTSTLTPNKPPTTTPTDVSDREAGGAPSAVFAVVGGMVVVIIALILIVILLIIFLVRKNRNQKDGSHVANPVYDIASQSTKTKHSSVHSTIPNECEYIHKQEEDISRVFHNTLYSTTPPKSNEWKSSNGETQSNGYYEEPQYSVPSDLVPATQYETPVITSPTGAKEPTQSPPPVYDYAAVPQSTAPEYAVLEPQACVYHYLESPETHTAAPAAGYSEKTETAKEGQKVAGNHFEKTLTQNHIYSAIEPN